MPGHVSGTIRNRPFFVPKWPFWGPSKGPTELHGGCAPSRAMCAATAFIRVVLPYALHRSRQKGGAREGTGSLQNPMVSI